MRMMVPRRKAPYKKDPNLKDYAASENTLHFLWTKDAYFIKAFGFFAKTLRIYSETPCKKDLSEYIRRFTSKVENIKACLKSVTPENAESGVPELYKAAITHPSVLRFGEKDEPVARSIAYDPLWKIALNNFDLGFPNFVKYSRKSYWNRVENCADLYIEIDEVFASLVNIDLLIDLAQNLCIGTKHDVKKSANKLSKLLSVYPPRILPEPTLRMLVDWANIKL